MTDITRTRAISAIWKRGERFDREAYAAKNAEARKTLSTGISLPAMVSDFESGTPTVALGVGWLTSTDSMIGGKSSGALEVVDGGAGNSKHALRVIANVVSGAPQPWAGAIMFPGGTPPAPVDLSSAEGFRFTARGDGAAYQVALGTARTGRGNVTRPFTPTAQWQMYTFRWKDFENVDGRDIVRIVIAAGPAPGRYTLFIDDFEIR